MVDKKKLVAVYVEDETEMIDLMRFYLDPQKFDLIGAVGGQIGLETIRRVKPDLVLLDLMMPDMDGWEVYRRVRADETLNDTRVIVVTARASPIDIAVGNLAKVDDYITKPFGREQFLNRVYQVLQREG